MKPDPLGFFQRFTAPDPKSGTARERVRKLRAQNPYITQSELARQIGVTRERVRQLLIKLGLPGVVPLPPVYQTCLECKKQFLPGKRGNPLYRSRLLYCDQHCRTLAIWGLYPCEICGTDVAMRHKEYQHRKKVNRTFTCSYSCRGATIKTQNTTLWRLHKEHIGARALRSSTAAVPIKFRKQYGLEKPPYRSYQPKSRTMEE